MKIATNKATLSVFQVLEPGFRYPSGSVFRVCDVNQWENPA